MRQKVSLIIVVLILSLSVSVIVYGPERVRAALSEVASTDTIGTLRINFNSLFNFTYPSSTTLGGFASLATTTGNIPVASSSARGGWCALSVGSNGQILTASSSATCGVAWGPDTTGSAGLGITTSTVGDF